MNFYRNNPNINFNTRVVLNDREPCKRLEFEALYITKYIDSISMNLECNKPDNDEFNKSVAKLNEAKVKLVTENESIISALITEGCLVSRQMNIEDLESKIQEQMHIDSYAFYTYIPENMYKDKTCLEVLLKYMYLKVLSRIYTKHAGGAYLLNFYMYTDNQKHTIFIEDNDSLIRKIKKDWNIIEGE